MKTHIVCVNTGTKYSNEYVNILCDSIMRNLDSLTPFTFTCFTNKPEGLDEHILVRELPAELEGSGWFNKLYLFKNGLFPDGDRIVYFDLKNVIISDLDPVIAYAGEFAVLRDFMREDGWQNSLMSWKANTLGWLWESFKQQDYPEFVGGDQAWIQSVFKSDSDMFLSRLDDMNSVQKMKVDFWQDLFPDAFHSYKMSNCIAGIPKFAKIVFFHGEPCPDQVKDGWVPRVWKIGGWTPFQDIVECNTSREDIVANIKHALIMNKDMVTEQKPPHKGHAVIVGGGPSIAGYVDELQFRQKIGQTIIALNNSWEWLEKHDIPVMYHVMADARVENEDFIPPKQSIHKLYATQCHSNVTRCADTLWNCLSLDLVPDFEKIQKMFWIGAGHTVGIRTIYLMYAMGYREFHLYGFDSCYVGENGHAYEQTLNKGERIIDVEIDDRKFKAAPWMVTQVYDFLETAEHFTKIGCVFTIHGDGLLQHAAQHSLEEVKAAA